MNVIYLKDILHKEYVETYSEFYLSLALAKVAKRLFGYAVDMQGIRIDEAYLTDTSLQHFKDLVSSGYILMGNDISASCSDDEAIEESMDVNVSYFKNEKLFDEGEDKDYWNFEYAEKTYDRKNYLAFCEFKKLGNTMLSLVSYHMLQWYLGYKPYKVLHIDIEDIWSRNMLLYTSIYSCKKTMPWFDEYIELVVEADKKNEIDIDYHLFCNNAYMCKKLGAYNAKEKIELMKKCNMSEGSILLLFERDGMCSNNKYGNLKSVKMIRLDEIGHDFIGYSELPLNKTKEEAFQDYMDIDEDLRYMFSDVLDVSPRISSGVRTLYNVGIDGYFSQEEEYILTTIDPYAKIAKTITINGSIGKVLMSEIDAIYWLLCQYGIEFDKELYKEMYSGGKDLMWDIKESLEDSILDK